VLAKGHARSSDPCALAGYLGLSRKFDAAITTFALRHGDPAASDHEEFAAAVNSGRIKIGGDPKTRVASKAT